MGSGSDAVQIGNVFALIVGGETRPTETELALRHMQAFLAQVSQAACNALHKLEQRDCARFSDRGFAQVAQQLF